MAGRLALLLACATLLTVARADARTEGGDVLWQDQFDVLEVAAADGRVAAVGAVAGVGGRRTPVVRVYDAAKGRLLWQAVVIAQSVIVDGNRVVVAGGGTVRGYDAKKGRLEWWDTPPFVVAQLYRDEETTLATATSDDGTQIRLRVYDTKRGTVLVPDRTLPVEGMTAFSTGRMFAATQVAVPDPSGSGSRIFPCHVTAYSIATGDRLWEVTQPVLVPNTSFCLPRAVLADRQRVLVAGVGGFGDEFMAQAYDARSGEFLWQHLPSIGSPAINAAIAIDTAKRLAFVAGWTRSLAPGARLADQDFVIHALDADTGVLRWDGRSRGPDCPPPPTAALCQVHAKLIVVDSGTVYGAGFAGESGGSIVGTGFLRAYEATSGALRWQEDDVDVLAMDATEGAVVVLTPAAAGDDVILRAYDGK